MIGTRPEVIKMAPIINKLKEHKNVNVFVISTAQHRELIDDVLKLFSITPDIDLNIMSQNQSLATLTGNLFIKLEAIFNDNNFDCVIAQGDTTTTFVTSMISFYHNIPFAHVEAGLRSFDIHKPFPEEINRVFVSKVASWHFAPTSREREYLLNEGILDSNIYITGNTVIDSLYNLVKRQTPLPFAISPNKRIILVTMHRRESFGNPIKEIFGALGEIADKYSDVEIIYPVHPNPSVRAAAKELLANNERIHLINPLTYDVFVSLLNSAYLVMSDSGGIQEEAPALDKPILILREVTERPLVVELGMGILVGTNKENIVKTASMLLEDSNKYKSMQKHESPYGDGHASDRIITAIITRLVGDK